jgi:aerobic-type carbon monoxide dehydrogenase small subunit (CoxS/CutS family)
MAGDDLLRRAAHPSHGEIEEGLAGNYCRCGCYYQIFEAVQATAAGEPERATMPSSHAPDLAPHVVDQ